jgi:ferredoxin
MEREIFTCGPAPYMKAVRDLLAEAGFDRARYHEESFSFDSLSPAEQAAASEGASAPVEGAGEAAASGETRYAVTFAKTHRDIECGAHEHVLDAAKRAGLRLPSSCTQGMCGTCKVKLVSGQVDMRHNGGIRQREIDQGMVLLCCSKPLSDLVVDK